MLQRGPSPRWARKAGVQRQLPAKGGPTVLSVAGFESKRVLTLRAKPGMRGPQGRGSVPVEGHCGRNGHVDEVMPGWRQGSSGQGGVRGEALPSGPGPGSRRPDGGPAWLRKWSSPFFSRNLCSPGGVFSSLVLLSLFGPIPLGKQQSLIELGIEIP